MAIHPGASVFPEAARRKVAAGPLFDKGDAVPLNEDECCVVGALLFAAKPDLPRVGFYEIPDATTVLNTLGLRYATEQEAELVCRRIGQLMSRNDRGNYADRARLVADLLGEPPRAGGAGDAGRGEATTR